MTRYARVLVEVEPDHLDRPFDYAIPEDGDGPAVQVGSRVEVVFAGRRTRGIVLALTEETSAERVRPLRRVLGEHVWVTSREVEIIRWAADRYAAPAADVVRHALPGRVIDVERRAAVQGWYPTAPRGPFPAGPDGDRAEDDGWGAYGDRGRQLVEAAADGSGAFFLRPLPGDDLTARITGLVAACLRGDRDVLVCVPGPRSAVADAVARIAPDLTVDVRGEAKTRRTYRAWLSARTGRARVVIGEQGVAFWPLQRLGLALVVDEASASFKARRSPYHHAREVLLERARRESGVAVLVGYVPSAPAWRLLQQRRLTPVMAARADERSAAPVVHLDARTSGPRTRLGRGTLDALRGAVGAGRLAVVLASRRGDGHALACTGCGLRLTCSTCAASVRREGRGTYCPSCATVVAAEPRCERCRETRFAPLAAGAERLGAELTRTFRDVPVAVLEGYAQPIPQPPAIVVMTRGSVTIEPPGEVGAVTVPDLDGLLRRPGLDASEDTLRLVMTAAAWGPAVVVQTDEPRHHAVQALVRWDPGGFWREEAATRAELRFPPAAWSIRVDADGTDIASDLGGALPTGDELLGPLPAGARSLWLIKSSDRIATVTALAPLRHAWSRGGRDVRIDVDPLDVP